MYMSNNYQLCCIPETNMLLNVNSKKIFLNKIKWCCPIEIDASHTVI